MGTIDTKFNSGFLKTPYIEKLANFSGVHVDMWWIGPCGPSTLLATKKASFGMMTCGLAIPSLWDKKLRTYQDIDFIFVLFMGQKVVFGSKSGTFGVFWTKNEVSDLTEGRRNHNGP